MSKTVVNEETGEEEVLYTKAELDAIEADAAAKVAAAEAEKKEKLDEFLKGKTAQELKEIERERRIEEINKKAEEAEARSKKIEETALEKIKGAEMTKYVGSDAALKAELQAAYDVLSGMPATTDEEIAARMLAAANMKGFNGPKQSIGGGMGTGYAPRFDATEDRSKDADHQKFLGALGLENIIPKKQ